MSATEPTLPPQTKVRDLDVEHRELVQQLYNHPDPHVRILAHMSERQLTMSQQMVEFSTLVGSFKEAMGSFKEAVDKLTARQEELEGYYKGNGLSASSDFAG